MDLLEPPPLPKADDTPDIKNIVKEKFEFDFPVRYIGLFVGTRGSHLKSLCDKHRIKNIHFGKENCPARRPAFIHTSPFPVSYEYSVEDGDKANGFQKALHNWASVVNKKREKHAEAVSTGLHMVT